VVDGAGRNDGDGETETGVAQAVAGRPQEARLETEKIETLKQASVDTNRDAPVGRSLADFQRCHHMLDRDDAVAADEMDEFAIAVAASSGRAGLRSRLGCPRRHHSPKTDEAANSPHLLSFMTPLAF
jgi:hypothetical protein